MSNAADLANLINRIQTELDRINTLIVDNDRTDLLPLYAVNVAYIGILKAIFYLKAIEEINLVIGNNDFDATGITFEHLLAIYTDVIAWTESQEQLLGLVSLTTVDKYPELDAAIKQRIISEVQTIFDTYNESLGSSVFVYDANNISSYTALQLYNDGIPFPYNRIEVGLYASSTSRANFEGTVFDYGLGNVVANSPKGVGSNLSYSTLNHIGASNQQNVLQSTGSAYFMSECIFFGSKYPQNVSLAEKNINFCDDPDPNDNTSPLDTFSSWLTLHCAGSYLDATYAWRDHKKLLLYFGYDVLEDGDGVVLSFPNFMFTLMRFDSPGGEWRDVANINTLYNKFRETGFADLETGDYVYHSLGTNSGHGFMIVGWGDAVNVAEGLNAQYLGATNLKIQRPRDTITNVPLDAIPYVADFGYGYRAEDPRASDPNVDPNTLDPERNKTGWLQDPRPRPFYASAAQLNQSQLLANFSNLASPSIQDYELRLRSFFQRFTDEANQPTSWRFFHLPNHIRIPLTQLVQLNWSS